MNTMNPMTAMEAPGVEKMETLKDIIQEISAINYEMDAQLQMIADALAHAGQRSNNDKNPDDPLTIMDSMRRERDKAQENLKLLVSIREYLW